MLHKKRKPMYCMYNYITPDLGPTKFIDLNEANICLSNLCMSSTLTDKFPYMCKSCILQVELL